ncbi:MAG: flagellar hook protein FlgE [Acidimicrobiales bacterium]
MIRSMYAAVSGLRSHQMMMDIIGNNIANVNTHGFKKGRATFEDVLSQVITGAAAPTPDLGGRNPAQIGLGVTVAGIAQNLGQGALQVTNRDLDLAIQGDGFFVLNLGGEEMFTRAGAFFLDADGRMVSNEGALVMGWAADTDGNINTSTVPTSIRIPTGDQHPPVTTTEAKFGGNLPSDDPVGSQLFSGLEIFDEQGVPTKLDLTFEKTNTNEWTMSASHGTPGTPIALTDNVLTFGTDGELLTPADFDVNIAPGQIPGVGAVALTIGGPGESRVTQFGGMSSIAAITQNGAAAGTLQSLRVGVDGIIVGAYNNSLVKPIAQVALASFANPEGLERVTGSNFRTTTNSGLAQVGTVRTGGRGTVAPLSLEMSNVDLAEEFTDLIRSQRGFQANSRMVTVSDELLQEIVNLKR